MEIRLLIHNIGFLASTFAVLIMGVFVLVKNPKKIANIMFALTCVSVAVFTFSHFFGVNAQDGELSRKILMFNLSIIFISLFLSHSVFASINRLKEQKIPLILIYVFSIAMFVFYILYPESFLKTSVPKMYFPNYYVPGNLHWVMRLISDIIIPVYFMLVLIREYFRADRITKNRIKYFLWGLSVAYLVGSIAILLVYDIQIDPLLAGPFMVLFAIPFAYGVAYYELLDIKVVAKNAFIYSFYVCLVGIVLVVLNHLNNYFLDKYANFPVWVLPFVISVITVSISYLIFWEIRKADMLKSEFVRIIMHRFRAPLTHIKWSAQELKDFCSSEPSKEKFLDRIMEECKRLTDITNLLSLIGETKTREKIYNFSYMDINKTISSLIENYKKQLQKKNITIKTSFESDGRIYGPEQQLNIIIETLINNAITYTPEGGKIDVSVYRDSKKIYVKVSDSGIGISSDEFPLLFTNFFRGKNAKKIDTEGMGVGLFIAKKIIKRCGGDIYASSPGVNKGAVFTVVLPIITAR